ncbi:SPOR domain-containing protein [Massilia sp. TWP1-3-3]|uniref:SPOR domain-containing protein n=1 Tax=Massilia sp. TWP1-3-3 TaxID=2804573 RepID=UPI003CEF6F1F
MGLFSFLNKNKQEAADEDSSYVARDDDAAAGARARSKRASSAGEPAARRTKDGRAAVDPVLPEKKRARRRLVGAIALALAVAVGLPMILDSEPKPLATDIDIRIPAKDRAPAQPLPAPVAAAETLDKSEVIVPPPNSFVPPADPAPPAREVAEVRPVALKPALKSDPKPDLKPALKIDPKPELKPEVKPDPKPARVEPRTVDKPAVKLAEAKPDARTEDERAMAILEDKPAAPISQKIVWQVAALASQDKANELQARLKAAGVASFTKKGASPNGELIRVRVGPFSKEEGDKIRPKLAKMGLSASVVSH